MPPCLDQLPGKARRSIEQEAMRLAPVLQEVIAEPSRATRRETLAAAWVAAALHDGPQPLAELLCCLDALRHTPILHEEARWAFARLQANGWLTRMGDTIGLTPVGQAQVNDVYVPGGGWGAVQRLHARMATSDTW